MKVVPTSIFGMFIAALIICSCVKSTTNQYGYPTSTVPDVSTIAVSNIGSTTATGGGNVTSPEAGLLQEEFAMIQQSFRTLILRLIHMMEQEQECSPAI
ncbi:MAG: hypothetical protein M0Q38_04565 [Bacteroidales bacterium]|jgi:hypothetical protein|nr:hypothetical protein [Bacteroidales bacterium]